MQTEGVGGWAAGQMEEFDCEATILYSTKCTTRVVLLKLQITPAPLAEVRWSVEITPLVESGSGWIPILSNAYYIRKVLPPSPSLPPVYPTQPFQKPWLQFI